MRRPFPRVQRALLIALPALYVVSGQLYAADYSSQFEQVNPSVVVIRTLERSLPRSYGMTPVVAGGLGSGVLIAPDQVLTAVHVVELADVVEVEFLDGHISKARVVSAETLADLALLELESPPTNIRPATLGDSNEVKVGEEVFVIGAPYGLEHTLTIGHISGRHRPEGTMDMFGMAELLQTDAAINQGNSGGPMFNRKGEVIGIVSYILSQTGGFEGLGFAVSSNTARDLVIERRGFWSGVNGLILPEPLARALNVPEGYNGILIQQVANGSPGQRAGLRVGTVPITLEGQDLVLGGDIVLTIMGARIINEDRAMLGLREKLSDVGAGETIELEVLRDGMRKTLTMRMP